MDLIYLDNNSTTRTAPEVLEVMLPYLSDFYGNASSGHEFGKKVNSAVKKARAQVADLIDCDSNEIVFTAGATEAINLAIKGICRHKSNQKRHIITVETEHAAVIDVYKDLESYGYEVTCLPVNRDGLIKIDNLKDALRADTALVSIMLVNNETGVIQPIQELARLTHNANALFMTDATQAVGKMSVGVDELDIDLMAFSAHKFYGPKGVGALYVRQRSTRRVPLDPVIHGGGHERSLRSGTLNVPGIVGMGKACELAQSMMDNDAKRIVDMRDRLEVALLEIDGAFVNGSRVDRLYNVINITLPNTDANVLIGQLRNIALSNGSACSSAVFKPSHVLKAMGLTDDEAFGAIRVSLGRYTTENDIVRAAEAIKQRVHAVRY